MELGYEHTWLNSKHFRESTEQFFDDKYKVSIHFDTDYVDETIDFYVKCEDLKDSSIIFESEKTLLSSSNTFHYPLDYSLKFPFFTIKLVRGDDFNGEKRLVMRFYNDEECISLIIEKEIVFNGSDHAFTHFEGVVKVILRTLKGEIHFSDSIRRMRNRIEEERENRLETGYNSNNKSCDLTFYSDNGDDVYLRLLNESAGDKKLPEIEIYKRNKENDKYEEVRNYVVDETPDFQGVVVLSEKGYKCVVPVKTPDGKKKYLCFTSRFDVGNPSHLMLRISEHKLYGFTYGSLGEKDLFKVDCLTIYTSNRFLLTEFVHFIEKYIIPNSETKYSINLDSVPKHKR